jgi:hypothetical protein
MAAARAAGEAPTPGETATDELSDVSQAFDLLVDALAAAVARKLGI